MRTIDQIEEDITRAEELGDCYSISATPLHVLYEELARTVDALRAGVTPDEEEAFKALESSANELPKVTFGVDFSNEPSQTTFVEFIGNRFNKVL